MAMFSNLSQLVESLNGAGVVVVAILGIVAVAVVWIAFRLRRR